MPQFEYDEQLYREKKLVINLQGKPYLIVNGRYRLAHESAQLIGMEVEQQDLDDADWITFKASAKVFNPHHISTLAEIKEKCGDDVAVMVAEELLFSTYDGYAKSPKEGSPLWEALDKRAPEKARPMEKAATDAAGRALSAAGFGEGESFASGDEVESAIERGKVYEKAAKTGAPVVSSNTTDAPSDAQLGFAATLIKQKYGATTREEADAVTTKLMGKTVEQMSKRELSALINKLKGPDKKGASSDEPPF